MQVIIIHKNNLKQNTELLFLQTFHQPCYPSVRKSPTFCKSFSKQSQKVTVANIQPHRRSGLATLPSVGAIP